MFRSLSASIGKTLLRQLIPNVGSIVVFALVVFSYRAWAMPGNAPAAPGSMPGAISYQGTLTDAAGQPLSETVGITFRLYNTPTGGTALWTEAHTGANAVPVSNGVFHTLLGSLTPIPTNVWSGESIYLSLQVGSDAEMTPREQLTSAPYAMQASQAWTVPDGSITTAKISDGAVTTAKITDGSVTTAKLKLDTDMDMRRNRIQNVLAMEGPSDDAINIIANSDHFPNGFPQGGWMWLAGINNPFDPGSVRIHIAKDLTKGNAPFFDIVRIQDNGAAARLFTIDENGNLSAAGAKSAVVPTASYGQRKLYAVEAPDVRFSDEGMARLQNGVARVDLDPIFLETIEGEFLVHITPYGDTSVYVAEVGKDFFVVKAREGDANAAFAWRLSAARKGYAGVRLQEVQSNVGG